MGLSLKKLGKSIGHVLSGAGHVAAGVERQLNPLDAGLSYKTKVAAPQNKQQSSFQQVVGIAKPIVHPFSTLGSAVIHTPQAIGREIQNKPIGDIQKHVFGTTNPTSIGKQIISDVAQTGLTFGAPGLSRGIEAGASRFVPPAVPKVVAGVAPKVVSNATIGGAFNATNAAGSGANFKQTLKAAGVGATAAGALPIAVAATKPVVKFTTSAVENRVPLNSAGAKPVIPGGGGDARVPKPRVSLKQSPFTNQELLVGKALGMSKKDIVAAKNDNGLAGAFKTKTSQMSSDELANLKPSEQMAVKQLSGSGPGVVAPPKVNTARNPFKASLPVVGHNDFGQVIANEQVASEIGKDNTLRLMEQAKKANPEEFKNFWEHANGDPGFKEAPKSPEMQAALDAWRISDNRIHGNSQALGGNTNYLQDHGLHPVVFNEDITNQLVNGTDPNKFSGLNNLSRKHPTMASLRAAAEKGGFTVGTDPLSEANHYLSASEHALRRRAIIKGVGEADAANLEKPHTLSLGSGEKNRVDISAGAHNELRGLQRSIPFQNKVVKGARTANVATKSTLLSFGQFHPNNISLMRAAPTLAVPKPSTAFYRNAEGKMKFDPTMSAHPVRAAKGLYATYRPLVPGSGTDFAAKVNAKAVADGMDLKAARIGAPYNAQLFDASGSSIAGVGHKLLGRQMLGMHDQAVRAMVGDLEKRGIPLDSEEARTAGKAVNNMMGFVNNEAQKIPPVVSRSMGDWLLARQFTHSKLSQLRTGATKGGVGGAYARANVAANVAASTAVIVGVGYILTQKSDNIRDALIRAVTDPAIPTPMKDSRGNTVKLRLPGTDASDVAKLLGIKSVRQADGHLGINWKPSNLPSTVEDFARARLSPLASIPVKIGTNENYAGKPLFDPNAPLGTKAEQAGTILGTGLLPIGLQGVPMVKAVEKHLPGNVQDVLNANKPGGNPLVKSLGSSFGVTPTTDATVGKGLETSRYFSALDSAKQGLNRQEKDVLDLYSGSKKNPVTGKYDVQPSVNDARTKASSLLQNPKVVDKLLAMNATLAKQGSKIDPLWQQSKDQITRYLQYQAMPPGSADKTDWYNKNQGWYAPLVDKRNAFFDSLPAGDPNKPKLDLQYPEASKQVSGLMTQYSDLTDPTQKGAFLDAHPDVIKQWNAQADYTNKLRDALGYSLFKNYPEATDQLQKFIDQYSGSDKGTKKGIRSANPQKYQEMIAYFDSLDLYNIGKQASVSQLQGEPDYTSKEAKAISGLAKDIYQNPDGTYSIVPAGWMNGLNNDSGGGGYGSSGGSSGRTSVPAPYKYALPLDAGGTIARPKVTARLATASKSKLGKTAKPKVTLKASKV